jgi:hypothetical protein
VGDEVEERAGEVGHQFLWLGGRMLTGEGLPMAVMLSGADERPSAALEWSVRYPVSLQSSWMQTGNADGAGLLWGRSLRWPATGCGAPLEEEGGALAAVAGA